MRLRATVARPPKDTARFSLPVTAYRCSDGRSLLLQAVSPLGNGVLVRLRYGDSPVPGSYDIVGLSDTTTRGASVGIRYAIQDAPRAFFLDSGGVELRREAGTLAARIAGRGIEAALRTSATVEIEGVPLPADTIPCRSDT